MSERGRIDTHQHIVPPPYREWLTGQGLTAGGKSIPRWSAQAALDLMATNDIETGILSVSTPGVEPAHPAEARGKCRALNEYTATVCADHPGRFGFFATLTLPDVDGALSEAAYAFDELGADGVILLANSKGTYLGDSSFDPLLEELNRRSAVIFVHPSELPAAPLPGIPPYAADFLLDTTRAALNLARSGSLTRYPDLKIILSHAGGFLPYAAYRMSATASASGDAADGIALLRRFWFDTALSSTPFALPSLTAFADPTKITFGSDFPYASSERSTAFTRGLDAYQDIDHHAVNRGNAEALFPRLAATPAVASAVAPPV